MPAESLNRYKVCRMMQQRHCLAYRRQSEAHLAGGLDKTRVNRKLDRDPQEIEDSGVEITGATRAEDSESQSLREFFSQYWRRWSESWLEMDGSDVAVQIFNSTHKFQLQPKVNAHWLLNKPIPVGTDDVSNARSH